MPGLDPGISLRDAHCHPKRDHRDKPGDDNRESETTAVRRSRFASPAWKEEKRTVAENKKKTRRLPGPFHFPRSTTSSWLYRLLDLGFGIDIRIDTATRLGFDVNIAIALDAGSGRGAARCVTGGPGRALRR